MKRGFVLLVIWLLPGAVMAQLTMSFGSADVTVSGMTRGGTAALVSLSSDVENWMAKVSSFSVVLSDQDGDGSETYKLSSPLVKRSLWVAIDVSTGESIVVSPGLAGLRSKLDPSEAIEQGAGGLYNILADKRTVLELTVVRPKVGAWQIQAWDGGKNDVDGAADGVIMIDSQTMTQMESGGAQLKDFRAGDVLLGLDYSNLEFYAVAVSSPPGSKSSS